MGASGFLLKRCVASELFQAIRDVLHGKPYVTPLAARGMAASSFLGGKSRRANARLTPRQREILQLLAEGHTMKEAAKILNITPRTVAYHKYRMMEELKLKSSAALVQLAIRKGILSP
jgi:DNA-binding NarL/FixJ family response regulator